MTEPDDRTTVTTRTTRTMDAGSGDPQQIPTPSQAARVPDAPGPGLGAPAPRAYVPAPDRGPMPPARSMIQTGALVLPRDRVRWGPVVAGLLTAVTTLILLSLLAIALGITVGTSSDTTPGTDVLSIGAAATAALIGVISFFIGGLVAARTAAVEGRGTGAFNGFLVWALGIVLILALAAMGLGAVLGAAGNIVGSTGVPNVNAPNVSPGQATEIGRNSALGALISLAIPAIAALLGGALGARTDVEQVEA